MGFLNRGRYHDVRLFCEGPKHRQVLGAKHVSNAGSVMEAFDHHLTATWCMIFFLGQPRCWHGVLPRAVVLAQPQLPAHALHQQPLRPLPGRLPVQLRRRARPILQQIHARGRCQQHVHLPCIDGARGVGWRLPVLPWAKIRGTVPVPVQDARGLAEAWARHWEHHGPAKHCCGKQASPGAGEAAFAHRHPRLACPFVPQPLSGETNFNPGFKKKHSNFVQILIERRGRASGMGSCALRAPALGLPIMSSSHTRGGLHRQCLTNNGGTRRRSRGLGVCEFLVLAEGWCWCLCVEAVGFCDH